MCRAVRSFDLWRLPERCSRSPASLWAQSKVEERQYPATADGRRLEVCCYPSHGSAWHQPVQTRPLVRILRPYMASLHSCGRPRASELQRRDFRTVWRQAHARYAGTAAGKRVLGAPRGREGWCRADIAGPAAFHFCRPTSSTPARSSLSQLMWLDLGFDR